MPEHSCSQCACVSTPKEILSKDIIIISARYTSLYSLKYLVFKPSPSHRVRHSDFMSKSRRGSRYGGRRLWARGNSFHCMRVPTFNSTANQTTFCSQLKCVLIPQHICLRRICVSTPSKIPSKCNKSKRHVLELELELENCLFDKKKIQT